MTPLLIALLLQAFAVRAADSQELTLAKALSLASGHSPETSVSRARIDEAQNEIGIARSGYLPELNFEAIDSGGFPGSSSMTGVGGLMGSPYRSGAAYGVTLRQTLWDFGRTRASVEAANQQLEATKADLGITLFQVRLATAKTFFECSLYRSQAETWDSLRKESQVVASEVGRLVKTGQRSVVERYLVDAQTEEAATAEAGFHERLTASQVQLQILTGLPGPAPCASLPETAPSVLPHSQPGIQSPFLERAQAEILASRARLDAAKAGHLPTIVGVASVGDVEKARFVDKQAYSVAAGFILPLFDGLRTTHAVNQAEALVQEKESALEAERERLDDLNSKLDGILNSAMARLSHLVREEELAEKGFVMAKKRYFAFQGTLVDLREALRNIVRTRTQLNEAKDELLDTQAAKALLNGENP